MRFESIEKRTDLDRQVVILAGVIGIVSFVYVMPAFADAGLPWETPLQVIVNALSSTTGSLMATLAVMVVGVLALMGRISWAHAGAVLFGIACLFGAGRIVAIFNA